MTTTRLSEIIPCRFKPYPAYKDSGAPPPIFEERQGVVIVTFKARLVVEGAAGASGAESRDQVTAEVTAQVVAFCREPQPAKAIMAELGLKHWKTFQTNYLTPLMAMGMLERTIPDKPRSRLQRYRATAEGLAVLKTQGRKP